MASPLINLTTLDPDLAKQSLVSYLKNQSFFRGYDFDGSNFNEIISLLSVNTFKFNFYLNMVNAESWLDSAQLRSSVISHAKDLNYLPRSFRSSKGIVSLSIPTDGLINIISIPKGTTFSGRVGIKSYNFSVDQTALVTSLTSVFSLPTLDIYEGIYLSDVYVKDVNIVKQRFVISNKNVDTDSITVTVTLSTGSTTYEYTYAPSLLGLLPNSLSYFLQCNEKEQYEVLFGNDLFGLEPPNGSVINITYRVAHGSEADGVEGFTINRDISEGHLTGSISCETVQASIGGDEAESIESIRFSAPRHYATQERAVNESDYETLMKNKFPEIRACAAFGGETQNPPVYGTVYISVLLTDVSGLPDSKKIEYYNFIRPRAIMTPVFITPQILYYSINSIVNYNINNTDLLPEDISTIVIAALTQYNEDNFNDFKVKLRYSKVIAEIDDSNDSILSNETNINVYVKLFPEPLVTQNINIKFGMSIFTDYPRIPLTHDANEIHAVYSTSFIFDNQLVFLEDDSLGNIKIVKAEKDKHVVLQTIGTVDYATGEINIINIEIQSYNGHIKVFIQPNEKDIEITGNNVLDLEPSEIKLDIRRVQE